jgi:hypothetical protein
MRGAGDVQASGLRAFSRPVPRRPARRTLAATPEDNLFTPVGTAAVPRTSARDILSSPFAGQTPRFAPDTTFFDSHITPMTKDMT